MTGPQVHRLATMAFSVVMMAIGVALTVQAAGAGGISPRLLLGVLFIAAGLGRMYVEVRRGRGA
jgi:hypothetical protein